MVELLDIVSSPEEEGSQTTWMTAKLKDPFEVVRYDMEIDLQRF
jgi:hypothetical protein